MRENKPMKLLSVAIPCYNSAAYMRNCIESLLPGGDEVEILIVDDGSTKDNTAEIADEYERNYPGICRAIHQENGGHGEAVNAGLRNATGVYYTPLLLSLLYFCLVLYCRLYSKLLHHSFHQLRILLLLHSRFSSRLLRVLLLE